MSLEQNSNRSIKYGAILSYASVFITIIITFFYTPWMIRQIGLSNYGLYNLVITFIAYFVMDFGMSGTVTRFLAKYRAEGNIEKIKNVLGLFLRIYLAIDILIFVVLFVLYFFISDIFHGLTFDEIEKLKVLYSIAAIFSVLSFVLKPFSGAMIAYEYFVEARIIDIIQRVGISVFIVIALLLGMGVYALVLINGAIAFLTSVLSYLIFCRKSKININYHYYNKIEMKVLLSFSIWIFLITMAQRFRLTFMPSLLGVLSNSVQISIFSLGMSIEGMVYVISSALNGLFLAKVTRLSHEGDSHAITDLMIRVGRLQLFLFSIIFFGFIILGRDFLYLWVGNDFADSYYVILLLIGTNIVSFTQSVASDLVYAENRVKKYATLTFVASALIFIGAVLLIPIWGAIGCAVSFFTGLVINQIQLNLFYKNELSINVVRFFKLCHLKLLPLLGLIAVVFYIIKIYITIDSWTKFFLFGLFFSLVMVAIQYWLLLNKDEKNLIMSLFPKKHLI